MSSKQQIDRINWIDVAKGYGIILVIIGHTTWLMDYKWSTVLCGVIYSFHMPLFFMISGYLMNPMKYNPDIFIKKRAKGMLIPYAFLGLVIILANWLFYNIGDMKALKDYFVELIVQKRFHVIWYLLVLFVAEIILYFIVRALKDITWQIMIICFLLSLIGIAYYSQGGKPLPWNLDVVPTAVFFLAIGYCLRKVKFKNDVKFLVIALLANIICGIINMLIFGGGLEMFGGKYAVYPLTVIGAVGGVYVVYWLSCKKDFKIISHIGHHSLVYFGLHQALTIPLLEMICDAMKWFPDKSNPVQGVTFIIIEVITSLALLTVIQLPLSKTKAKFLIGE